MGSEVCVMHIIVSHIYPFGVGTKVPKCAWGLLEVAAQPAESTLREMKSSVPATGKAFCPAPCGFSPHPGRVLWRDAGSCTRANFGEWDQPREESRHTPPRLLAVSLSRLGASACAWR